MLAKQAQSNRVSQSTVLRKSLKHLYATDITPNSNTNMGIELSMHALHLLEPRSKSEWDLLNPLETENAGKITEEWELLKALANFVTEL